MWILLSTSALGATAPSVELAWVRDHATLQVTAPSGSKIAPDAPARLSLSWAERSLDMSGDGKQLLTGVLLGDVRGTAAEGTLELALCDVATGECKPGRWTVQGQVPETKRGRLTLAIASPTHAESAFGPTATASGADQAFARAKQNGRAVLLDFSAVWCPPCNQLGAEVLHGPPADELDGYEVAVLDVDNPSSFDLKSRYEVRGYPTIVAVNADGVELSRTVGYTNRAAFLGWLAGAIVSNDGADFGRPPEQLSPERAAELGWMRVQQGEIELAKPWLARAEAATDGLPLRRLRFAVSATVGDLEWLVANAPASAEDFVGPAIDLHAVAPELVWEAVELALRTARGTDLANALSYAADATSDEATARAYNTAAASVLLSALKGDPEQDKAWISWLSHLQENGGDPEGAVQTLQQAVQTWPGEPTFDLSLAPLLTRLQRYDEALGSADRAMRLAWGDNHLRAALAKAEALRAMGRPEEARQVAEQELASQPAPPDGLAIRTPRYRQKLQAFIDIPPSH